MINVPQLLDAARSASSLPSDYRLSRVLGIADNTLYNYRHAGRVPTDDVVLRLANLAKLPAPYVLNCMAAERSKEPELRAAFLAAAAALKPAGVDKLPPSLRGGGGGETPIASASARFGDVHPARLTSYTLAQGCDAPGAAAFGLFAAIVQRRELLKKPRPKAPAKQTAQA